MASIAIIGAGIVGLTTAVTLQRRMPWIHVTLITERMSPDTTGDGSAGFWEPYLLGDTPQEDILNWSKRTYQVFRELWNSPSGGEAGLSLIPVIYFSQDPCKSLPLWRHAVLGFQEMSENEVSRLSSKCKKEIRYGFTYISFTCEPSKYLPMLLQEFKTGGGTLQLRRVENLNEFQESNYDVVINCSGLQARFVVPDLNVHPIRGQVMRAKAPWVFHCFMDDSEMPKGCYVIPNQDTIIMGGTSQHDWNVEVSPSDAEMIHTNCSQVLPSLKEAEIVTHWVGLRPGRFQVRLERECRKLPNGEHLEIVHNYAHGGAGITLSWGCAEAAVDIVHTILQEKSHKAKL